MADELTRATPLAVASSVSGADGVYLLKEAGYTLQQLVIGRFPGSIGETSKVAVLLGAIVLLVTRIGSWRIMTGGLLGMTAASLIANAMAPSFDNPSLYLTPVHHLLMGSFAFGLVFMATDPVSAAQTDRGRWIYGILIGSLIVMIRVLNQAFPEGVMLSILLANAFSPMIDYFVLRQNIARRQKAYARQ